MSNSMLPFDICRCVNAGCDIKDECRRWLERKDLGERTPISCIKPSGKDCVEFLPVINQVKESRQ